MYNRPDIASMLHNRNVLADFAGHFSMPGNLIRLHIDDAKIVRLHKTFADAGGGADDTVFVEAIGNVAVVCRCEAAIVKPAPDVADFFLDLFQIGHGV